MSEEELAAWRAQRAERVDARRTARTARDAKLAEALVSGQRIVLDCDFASLMTEQEIRSLMQQLSYCYSANSRAEVPAHLIFSGIAGGMDATLHKQMPGVNKWKVTLTDKPYIEHFAGAEGDLVYLTADSPNELQELDPSKAYIVGGLVDRNRHKGVCYEKAVAQGVATARLPIGEYLQLRASAVMCTNHVVEMLVKWLEVRDWEAAFKEVVPNRKRKGAEGQAEGQAEGGSGSDGGGGGEGGSKSRKEIEGPAGEEDTAQDGGDAV